MADQGEDARNLAGDPQMGEVYDSTVAYPALPKNTTQLQKVDPTGAAISNGEGRIPTYSAATVAYAPYASATDIFSISGSASKVVRLKRIAVSGRSTAASNIDVALVKRTTADSGGSPTALTAVLHDTTVNPAASAVISTYAAAPTTTGGVTLRAQQSNLSAAGSGGAATPVEWHFGDVNDQAVVLRGTAEQIAVNLGGGSVPAGATLNLFVEWSEE
ncbi:MAG: hypothetical protein ACLPKB_24455 [Xanthobacteraceae bacterium]